MKELDKILFSLPETFTRAEFMNAVSEQTAYSYSWAQQMLDSAVFDGMIERTNERGRYEKVTTNEQIEV